MRNLDYCAGKICPLLGNSGGSGIVCAYENCVQCEYSETANGKQKMWRCAWLNKIIKQEYAGPHEVDTSNIPSGRTDVPSQPRH